MHFNIIFVVTVFHRLFLIAGQQYLSPNALAEMWKEELVSSKTLEAKFRDIFSAKGVCLIFIMRIFWFSIW